LGLNERQIKTVLYVKENGKIINQKMKEISAISKATATRDLTELVDQYNLLVRIGETGVGTSYKLKGS
jgi:ATP-dependent DNA helicase RecG